MPRTKLEQFSRKPEAHRRMVNRTIREAMARQEIAHNKDLGAAIGLSETQTSNRFKRGWSDYELYRLGQVLHFTPDESVRLMGGRT